MEPEKQVASLPSPEATSQESLHQGLSKRAETMQVVAQARENLGQTATRREVNTDVHGNILSQRDLDDLRANGPQERASAGRIS
jgi:chorismate mutase